MNIAIVDDEDKEIDRLSEYIRYYAHDTGTDISIDTFHCAEEILPGFHPYAYTAIFMDIYMKEMDGIEAAGEILAADPAAKIIFLTSSVERMPDAFSIHAYDYIKKPAEQERIFRVMDDVMMHEKSLRDVPHFHFISNRKDVSISYPDIVCVRTNGRKQEITANDDSVYETGMLFSEINDVLAKDGRFLLLIRGVLVNMDYIAKVQDGMCILKDGRTLPIQIRRTKEIVETWQNYKLDSFRNERNRRRRR